MNNDFLGRLLDKFLDETKIVAFYLMTQGKENVTTLVQTEQQKVIVRIWGETHGYMGVHSEHDIQDEIAFMDFCFQHDIPVPKLYRSTAGNLYEQTPEGTFYTVMECIEGETPQQFSADMTEQIAQTMARMHVLVKDFAFPYPRSWPGSVFDMTNARIEAFIAGNFATSEPERAILTKAIAQYHALLKQTDLTALPQAVIHGDIMWENMKFKDGQLQAIFDFGDCRYSYYIEDIAKSLFFAFESPDHSIFGEDGQNVSVFLNAYEAIRPLSNTEKQSLPLLFVSRFLYQVLGYYGKISQGKLEYQAKVDSIFARYEQHQAFLFMQ